MPIAVTADHEELRQSVRRWAERHCPPETARATLDADPSALPAVWAQVAEQGWLGLHVPERAGGQGFGLLELAVALEELAVTLTPGPILATVVVAAALVLGGTEEQQARFLPGLCTGRTPAALHLGAPAVELRAHADAVAAHGRLSGVLGAPTAQLMVAPTLGGGCCIIECGPATPGLSIEAVSALDTTRALGTVTLQGVPLQSVHLLGDLDPAQLGDLALVLSAAEAAGAARWCVETASAYAKVRVQFGRPIGQFQAVKHKLADMLMAVEQSAAVAWDAAAAFDARLSGAGGVGEVALAASAAGAVAIEGAVRGAKDCIQVLGGIGFTWEHDAHLYLKRALASRQLQVDPDSLCARVCAAALTGVRRSVAGELPPEADVLRRALADDVAAVAAAGPGERRARLVERGLLAPHWPAPWGRDAGPLEQIVIDEALTAAGVSRPSLAVGAWALPTIIAHGSPEQQARWVGPTLRGELSWCQLFSEPGAGSDLASLATRAERVEGGWVLRGQKVWTSMARDADWGICLARSDPGAPKHEGITYFLVDMRSPGLDVRPLRELTGDALFNEVFLDDVVVPDDCVVGEPGQGWRIGRTTLANERVSMSSGATFGVGVESVLAQLARLGPDAPAGAGLRVGALVVEAQALGLLAQRITLRSLEGMDAGAMASVRKLLGVEHEQRVQELGLLLSGTAGAVRHSEAERWENGFLFTRCLTIAGGTSEVQRNVIAERLLGLPRDPEPGH